MQLWQPKGRIAQRSPIFCGSKFALAARGLKGLHYALWLPNLRE